MMTTRLAAFDSPVTSTFNFVLQWKDALVTGSTTPDKNIVEFAELESGERQLNFRGDAVTPFQALGVAVAYLR